MLSTYQPNVILIIFLCWSFITKCSLFFTISSVFLVYCHIFLILILTLFFRYFLRFLVKC